jgi:hypothetical protein
MRGAKTRCRSSVFETRSSSLTTKSPSEKTVAVITDAKMALLPAGCWAAAGDCAMSG